MTSKHTGTHQEQQVQNSCSISFEIPSCSYEKDNLHNSSEGFAIILCTQGSKTLQLNFKEYTLEPGGIVFFFPGSLWKPIKTSDDFQARYISINITHRERKAIIDLDTVFSLSAYISRNPHSSLSPEETAVICNYFDLMKNRYNAHANIPIMEHLLTTLLLELNQIFAVQAKHNPSKISRQEEILWQFLFLLKQHHKEERAVCFYADKLCITPKYLSSVTKILCEKTAHDIIADFVTLSAKRLLKTTTLSIQEISEELNFPNQSFFGKFFKQNTGTSPSSYRGK